MLQILGLAKLSSGPLVVYTLHLVAFVLKRLSGVQSNDCRGIPDTYLECCIVCYTTGAIGKSWKFHEGEGCW